jgi:malonyl-CoA decarboxylase
LPRVEQFATLSPVPGFRRWLDRHADDAEPPLDADTAAALSDPATWATPEASAAFEAPLTRLCARYLTETEPGRGPADPVARFHLGNGARLERINWRGNVSARGLQESFGMMVNYLYDPDTIEANHEVFATGGVVARSAAVDALLHPPRRRNGLRLR